MFILNVATTLDHKQPFHCIHLPIAAAKSPSGLVHLIETGAYHAYVLDYTIKDTMVVPNWLFEEMNFPTVARIEIIDDISTKMAPLNDVQLIFDTEYYDAPEWFLEQEIKDALFGRIVAPNQVISLVINGDHFTCHVASEVPGMITKDTSIACINVCTECNTRSFETYIEDWWTEILQDLYSNDFVHLKGFYTLHTESLSKRLRQEGFTVLSLKDCALFDEDERDDKLVVKVGERTASAPVKRMDMIIAEQHRHTVLLMTQVTRSNNLLAFIERVQDRDVTFVLLDEENLLSELKWKVHRLAVKRPEKVLGALVSEEMHRALHTRDYASFYAGQSHVLLGLDFGALHKLVRHCNQWGDPVKALDTVRKSLLQDAFCEMMIKEPQDKPWSRIGGYKETKRILHSLLYLPLDRPEAAKSFGIGPPSGILLAGPSGVGKRMFVESVAADRRYHVLHCTATMLFDRYLGDTEANIRKLFIKARELAPCVLFIEHIEAIGLKRGTHCVVKRRPFFIRIRSC